MRQKTFYQEYTDQFGDSAEIEVTASIEVQDIVDSNEWGKETKVGESLILCDVDVVDSKNLRLTDDDRDAIFQLIQERIPFFSNDFNW